MATNVTTPYSGARKLINTADIPTWMNPYDAERLASYNLYENIYWTVPQTYKLLQRGSEENPIYIPSGRIICNTIDRYAGPNWRPVMDGTYGTPEQQATALAFLKNLFKRERMASQYDANKLYGHIRGDWVFTITANAAKPVGTRLTLKAIDPGLVFPIPDPKDDDRDLGIDLIEQIMVGEDLRIKRVRYLKSEHPDHPSGSLMPGGPISYQVDVLEVENWETEPKTIKNPDYTVDPVELNPLITSVPVYRIKNFEEPQNPWGSSEMRGIERLFAAINQSITDEELTLALDGIGMYASEKGRPIDASGNPTNWVLGPGRVVHDETFKRIDGVRTVQPFLEHVKYIEERAHQVTGASDVARGIVDVTVAESGIALALRMGPILKSAERKETLIRESMDQFLFDLRVWAKVYEGVDLTGIMVESEFGEKMPKDNEKRFNELMQLYTADPPLITAAYFRDACREMGIEIPIDLDGAAVAEERAQMAEAMDPYGARVNEEMDAAGGEEEPPEEPVEEE